MEEDKTLTESNQSEEQATLTKEEILERSRKENSRGDERSENAMLRAGYIAMMSGGVFCTVLYLLYYFLLHEVHFELFCVYVFMWSVFTWVQFYYTRKKIQLVGAIAFTVAFTGFLILIILKFAGIE